MDELVAQIAASTGVDQATAGKAALIILRFLAQEAPADKVAALLDAIPGAREAAAASPGTSGPGVMGVFGDLMSAGVRMDDIAGLARAFVDVAREKAGPGPVDAVVASIPGLSQFV